MLKINTDQSHNASSDDFVLYPLPGQRFSNLKASKSQKIPFEEKQEAAGALNSLSEVL